MKRDSEESDLHLKETTVDGTAVFSGKLLDVRLDHVRLPNGGLATREYIRHQGAVVVIPVLDKGDLVFERQFRYPLGQVLIEFPAGKIDPGESIEETGKRELLEETGYVANDWRYLGVLHPCVGYSNERIEVFLAQGLSLQGAQNLDHGEHLDVFSMSLGDAIEAVRTGSITDAKTISAIFWAEKVLINNW